MPFRFKKTFKIAPGVKINLGKKGISTTVGKRGASVNFSKRGTRVTSGIPGTGISFSRLFGGKKNRAAPPTAPSMMTNAPQLASMPRPKKKIPIQAVIVAGIVAAGAQFLVCLGMITSIVTPSSTATPTLDLVSVQGTALAKAWLAFTQTALANPTSTMPPTSTLPPTETLAPTETLPPPPTATLIVVASPTLIVFPATNTPVQSAVCSCSGDTLNCTDFGSWSSAQACYTYCVSQGAGDIHGLDGNNDGSACDSLK